MEQLRILLMIKTQKQYDAKLKEYNELSQSLGDDYYLPNQESLATARLNELREELMTYNYAHATYMGGHQYGVKKI